MVQIFPYAKWLSCTPIQISIQMFRTSSALLFLRYFPLHSSCRDLLKQQRCPLSALNLSVCFNVFMFGRWGWCVLKVGNNPSGDL